MAMAKWQKPFSNKFEPIGSPLIISELHPNHFGEYICQLENGIEPNAIRSIHILPRANEQPKLFKPSITTLTITEGTNITLRCQCERCLDGSEEMVWIHKIDQNVIRSNPSEKLDADDLTNFISYSWKLINVSSNDSGVYICQFLNGFGEDEYSIQLNVNKPLNISNIKNGSHLKCIENKSVSTVVLKMENEMDYITSNVYDCKSLGAEHFDVGVMIIGKFIH